MAGDGFKLELKIKGGASGRPWMKHSEQTTGAVAYSFTLQVAFLRRFHQTPVPPVRAAMPPRSRVPGSGTAPITSNRAKDVGVPP